ncbi:MAG: CopG family transcriptional regulator [Saprospiraceae bacterium]
MSAFTIILPDMLLERIVVKAKSLSLQNNELIESVLELYLDDQEREEYIRTFKMTSQDEEVLSMSDEGMQDYLKLLDQ